MSTLTTYTSEERGTVALGHCLTATAAFLGKNGQFNIPRDSPFSSNSNFIDETNAAAATAANYAWKTTLIMTIRSNVDLIFLRCEQRNSISRFLGWLLLSANALMLRALMCCSTKYEYLKSGWWWQALPTRPPLPNSSLAPQICNVEFYLILKMENEDSQKKKMKCSSEKTAPKSRVLDDEEKNVRNAPCGMGVLGCWVKKFSI